MVFTWLNLLNLIINYFDPQSIIVGYDHHFGFNREGSPEFLTKLVEPLESNSFEMVFGSRIRGEALMGGMPLWKYIGNRFLTFMENMLLGLSLSEYHSGFRAYTSEALRIVNLDQTDDGFGVQNQKWLPSESMIPVLAAFLRKIEDEMTLEKKIIDNNTCHFEIWKR